MSWDLDFWIDGHAPSAKNSRRIVRMGKRSALIKSEKALAYVESFNAQCPVLPELLTGDLTLWIDAFYPSRRPDLACTELIMDLLQGKVYENDRQVKAQASTWNLDKENPRVRIMIRRISSGKCTEMSSLERSEIWGSAMP